MYNADRSCSGVEVHGIFHKAWSCSFGGCQPSIEAHDDRERKYTKFKIQKRLQLNDY